MVRTSLTPQSCEIHVDLVLSTSCIPISSVICSQSSHRPPHPLCHFKPTQTTLQDRFSITSQLDHLHAKYSGTGHPDTNRHEWASTMKRDTYANFIGRQDIAAYHSVAENESIGRVRYTWLQSMLSPVGPPPVKGDD
jgi:splicing factor 3B subunit 5